jgi:hypothetical protein
MPEPALRTRRRRHEPGEVDSRAIVVAAAGLAVALIVIAAAALGAHRMLRPDRPAAAPVAAEVPAPRLQSSPASDLRALLRQKNAMLDEYRWIDPSRGVVRIPIDRAMQLLIERQGRGTVPPSGPPR